MNAAPTTYAIRVEGHLDDHWSSRLGELAMSRDDDGRTTITVSVVDQAHLHGVLAGLRDIGAVLTELRTPGSRATSSRSVLERPLLTERLTLRPATVDDAGPTWTFRRLESVNEWLAGCPAELDTYRELFSETARLASTVIVTLGHGPAAPVIGDLMLRRRDAWAQVDVADQARGQEVELGWVFDPAYSGHGYASEAARELLRHSFTDLSARRVVASCLLDDTQSWRLMARLGMRRETHSARAALHRRGLWLDSVTYAVLADEWLRPSSVRPGQRP